MTYEEFERIGMSEGAPYAFCKLAWEMKPWRDMQLSGHEEPLRMAFRLMIEKLDSNALDALAFVSSFELQPRTLELLAKKITDDYADDYPNRKDAMSQHTPDCNNIHEPLPDTFVRERECGACGHQQNTRYVRASINADLLAALKAICAKCPVTPETLVELKSAQALIRRAEEGG